MVAKAVRKRDYNSLSLLRFLSVLLYCDLE